jgi:uncharacterized membrane protein YgdD (TMEM256/DUF423 family)
VAAAAIVRMLEVNMMAFGARLVHTKVTGPKSGTAFTYLWAVALTHLSIEIPIVRSKKNSILNGLLRFSFSCSETRTKCK